MRTQLPQLKPMQMMHRRYRIIRQRGKGGFGTVYQAEDTLLNLPVAIKEVVGDANGVQRVRYEAKLLAWLKHNSIPSFIDFFVDQDRWYLVMEWIEGRHIEDETLPMKHVIWFGKQLCDVVQYLHHCDPPIIHRDIKPTNILLTSQSRLYLLDFGISCSPGPNANTLGSLDYAAPELQMLGVTVTPRTDIYSMGILLWELLTGNLPSQDHEASVTLYQDMTSSDTQSISAEYQKLTMLLKRMTAHNPNDRPDCSVVWQELEHLGEELRHGGQKRQS